MDQPPPKPIPKRDPPCGHDSRIRDSVMRLPVVMCMKKGDLCPQDIQGQLSTDQTQCSSRNITQRNREAQSPANLDAKQWAHRDDTCSFRSTQIRFPTNCKTHMCSVT